MAKDAYILSKTPETLGIVEDLKKLIPYADDNGIIRLALRNELDRRTAGQPVKLPDYSNFEMEE